MVDYNEFLLNVYVVDLAPITGQSWFHSIIGGVAAAVATLGSASIVVQFFGDSVAGSIVTPAWALYSESVKPFLDTVLA
jgi:hypothetical protein